MVKHYLQQNSDTCQADFCLLPQKLFYPLSSYLWFFLGALCICLEFIFFYFNLVVKPFTTSFWPLVESKVFRLQQHKMYCFATHIQTATILFPYEYFPHCTLADTFLLKNKCYIRLWRKCVVSTDKHLLYPRYRKKFINKIFELS